MTGNAAAHTVMARLRADMESADKACNDAITRGIKVMKTQPERPRSIVEFYAKYQVPRPGGCGETQDRRILNALLRWDRDNAS